jgi:hypothetical protein
MAEMGEAAMKIMMELGRNLDNIATAHQQVQDVLGLTNQAH